MLAAGFGTRLAPLTQTVPKPLFPIGRLPLIAYAFRLLAHHGITDVIVNVHHLGKQLMHAVGDGAQYGVHVTYSEENGEILGTGGGLKRMQQALDDTFVVVNSDTILDVDLGDVLRRHESANATATMCLRRDKSQEAYGQIGIDGQGRIRNIVGHMRPVDQGTPLTSYMFTGVHVLEPSILEYVPPEIQSDIIRTGYFKALDNDEVLLGYVTDGYWVDAGTPARYFDANLDALTGTSRIRYATTLPPERTNGVWVAPDAHIAPSATLVPPVAITDRVHVGDNATVGPNVIVSPGAVIGNEVTISNSIVLDDVHVSARETIAHDIVGKKHRVSTDTKARGD